MSHNVALAPCFAPLAARYGHCALTRAVIDHQAVLQRPRHALTKSQIVAIARSARVPVRPTDAMALVNALAGLGLGKRLVGRRGGQTRIEWCVNPAEVARAVRAASSLAGNAPAQPEPVTVPAPSATEPSAPVVVVLGLLLAG